MMGRDILHRLSMSSRKLKLKEIARTSQITVLDAVRSRLDELIARGLVQFSKQTDRYGLTPAGVRYISKPDAPADLPPLVERADPLTARQRAAAREKIVKAKSVADRRRAFRDFKALHGEPEGTPQQQGLGL